MREHPCEDHRNALETRLAEAHEGLLEHLAHEEGQALPMLQRTVSEEENKAFEKAVGKAYPLKMFPFLLPWAMDEVPDDAYERMRTTVPPGYNLMLRLFRPRFERGEREPSATSDANYSGVVRAQPSASFSSSTNSAFASSLSLAQAGVTSLASVGTTIPSAVW